MTNPTNGTTAEPRWCLTCKHRNTEASLWTGNPCQGCGREPNFAKWEPVTPGAKEDQRG